VPAMHQGSTPASSPIHTLAQMPLAPPHHHYWDEGSAHGLLRPLPCDLHPQSPHKRYQCCRSSMQHHHAATVHMHRQAPLHHHRNPVRRCTTGPPVTARAVRRLPRANQATEAGRQAVAAMRARAVVVLTAHAKSRSRRRLVSLSAVGVSASCVICTGRAALFRPHRRIRPWKSSMMKSLRRGSRAWPRM
jgi:hypothetical protein